MKHVDLPKIDLIYKLTNQKEIILNQYCIKDILQCIPANNLNKDFNFLFSYGINIAQQSSELLNYNIFALYYTMMQLGDYIYQYIPSILEIYNNNQNNIYSIYDEYLLYCIERMMFLKSYFRIIILSSEQHNYFYKQVQTKYNKFTAFFERE